MKRILKVCPACGSACINRRTRAPVTEEKKYKCRACGEDFRTPSTKEARNDINHAPLPKMLRPHPKKQE